MEHRQPANPVHASIGVLLHSRPAKRWMRTKPKCQQIIIYSNRISTKIGEWAIENSSLCFDLAFIHFSYEFLAARTVPRRRPTKQTFRFNQINHHCLARVPHQPLIPAASTTTTIFIAIAIVGTIPTIAVAIAVVLTILAIIRQVKLCRIMVNQTVHQSRQVFNKLSLPKIITMLMASWAAALQVNRRCHATIVCDRQGSFTATNTSAHIHTRWYQAIFNVSFYPNTLLDRRQFR